MAKFNKADILKKLDEKIIQQEDFHKKNYEKYLKQFAEWQKNAVKLYADWVKKLKPVDISEKDNSYGGTPSFAGKPSFNAFSIQSNIRSLKNMRSRIDMMVGDIIEIRVNDNIFGMLD